jgi:hypothetical protein
VDEPREVETQEQGSGLDKTAYEATPIDTPADEETAGLSWRDRLRLMGWARSLLLALAFVALVLGGLNAWRAEASTALLIVGAVLAIFALVFGHDWREIQVQYGDAQARVFRGVDHVLEQAEQSSPSEPFRKQLAELRAEIETMAERAAAGDRRRREAARALSSPLPSAGIFLAKPQASHTFLDNTSVALSLQVPSSQGKTPYTCVVVTPDGERLVKEVEPPMAWLSTLGPSSYTVRFPDQFLGSRPLEPGLHEVEWRRGSAAEQQAVLAGETAAIAAALAAVTTLQLVARDSFTIPERQPVADRSA